jgi:hypothetical protein
VIKFGDEVIVIKFGDEVMSGITTLIREKANLSLVCPSLFYFMMPPFNVVTFFICIWSFHSRIPYALTILKFPIS